MRGWIRAGPLPALALGMGTVTARPVAAQEDPYSLVPDSLQVEYDTAPRLFNQEELQNELRRWAQRHSRTRVDGRLRIAYILFVNPVGDVSEVVLVQPSGYEEIDEDGRRVLERAKFFPAVRDGQPIGMWITRWLAFQQVFER